MLCKICGANIPDDAKICEFCGADTGVASDKPGIAADSAAATEGKEVFDDNERRRKEQMEKMLEDKKTQLSEIERRRQMKRQRQKRNKIILIALICALAVAAAGIGIYYVAQNVGNTPNVPTVSPLPTASSMPTIAPSPSASPSASPELSMTSAPTDGTSANVAATGSSTSGQSWSATGNTGSSSGGSSSSTGGSSSSRPSGTNASSGSSSSVNASAGNGKKPVSNSGVSTSNISSKLSIGGEVIKNTGTGRLLMTFIADDTRYYANVSEGSTTDQVKNKPYTITAVPTNETYNGNTVYEITTLTKYDGKNYVLPDSGTRLLTDNDLKGMSKYDLAIARNEIYARHGRKFQTAEYNRYFTSKSWYSINPNYNYSDDNSNLNPIEIKNVQFILAAERR